MNYLRVNSKSVMDFVQHLNSSGMAPADWWLKDFLDQHAKAAFASGEFIKMDQIEQVGLRAEKLIIDDDSSDKDSIEGALCGQLHSALSEVPIEILDDPGFWQYLGIKYFSKFIIWREESAFNKGNIGTYFLATKNSEMIPLRIYLRGAISEENGNYDLADAFGFATDFWRSHIVRVSTGSARTLAHEIIRSQNDERMSTGVLRDFAKLINRQWTNRELYFLDVSECGKIIDEARSIVDVDDELDEDDSQNPMVVLPPEVTEGSARKNTSRAKEFDLLFGYLDSPEILRTFISEHVSGATTDFEGISFEFGNIKRLEKLISIDRPLKPFLTQPKYLGHIDSLQVARKRELEETFNLTTGSISAPQSKVDLLIIDVSGQPFFISFKDASEQAKLGQVSTPTNFGASSLKGGLNISILDGRVPASFGYQDTAFSQARFNKLSAQDKSFAYFKKNYFSDWEIFTNECLIGATSQVEKLCSEMASDTSTFIDFFGKTLAGNLIDDSDFYLLMGDQPVHFKTVLDRMRQIDFKIDIERYEPRGKVSYVIHLETGSEKYCMLKIEPSFDGGSITAEQTKGIIYYFQQHLKSGNNYKQFLLDISQ